MRVPTVVSGGGFSGVVGGGFPVENEGKGEGVGSVGGWGGDRQAKEPASQCARVCQNYPSNFLDYTTPFYFSGIN